MPRKTKELEEMPAENTKKSTKTVTSTTKKATTKKSTPNETVAKKATTTKKATTKTAKATKTSSKTATKSTKKTTTTKSTPKKAIAKNVVTEKKVTTKTSKTTKANSKTTTKNTKKTATTKSSPKKATVKTSTSTKKVTTNVAKNKSSSATSKVSLVEYYDLPLRYNKTIVKILAQTPNMLFVYWDIADTDRKIFEEHYGDNFFKQTKPVLIIHNKTMNYSFEVEINDFANSWYLHVNDADCKYEIELGRRPIAHTSNIPEKYIYISSSNEMDSPNNHILFEKFNPSVKYKNLKNGNTTKRDFSSLSNYKNMQEIYNIYDLYKTIYKDELFGEISNGNLTNPSSMSSSSFK